MKIAENGKERVLRNLFIATSNRSDYIKVKPVLQEMKTRDIPFNIVVSGSHLALKQGYTYKSIEKDKFEIKEMLSCQIEGTSLESMSKSVGLSVMEHSHFFAREKPSSICWLGTGLTSSLLRLPPA